MECCGGCEKCEEGLGLQGSWHGCRCVHQGIQQPWSTRGLFMAKPLLLCCCHLKPQPQPQPSSYHPCLTATPCPPPCPQSIGVPLDEALKFWRQEFAPRTSGDKFEKEYAYNVRHNYGKEGNKKVRGAGLVVRLVKVLSQPGKGSLCWGPCVCILHAPSANLERCGCTCVTRCSHHGSTGTISSAGKLAAVTPHPSLLTPHRTPTPATTSGLHGAQLHQDHRHQGGPRGRARLSLQDHGRASAEGGDAEDAHRGQVGDGGG